MRTDFPRRTLTADGIERCVEKHWLRQTKDVADDAEDEGSRYHVYSDRTLRYEGEGLRTAEFIIRGHSFRRRRLKPI